MRDRNQLSQTDAVRQLAWSRSYLRREKRLRLLRRIVPLVLVAAVCTVGVYAAAGGELPAWPVGAPASTPAPASAPAPASVPAQAGSTPDDAVAPPVQQAAFTVTFDSRGGSDVAAQTDVAPGALLAAPDAPTREDYAFSGWYTDSARTRMWDFDADTVEQDLTLYAGWQAAAAPDGGQAMPQTGVESGALPWACVLAAALALAAGAALLLRRAYRERGEFRR